MGRIAKPRTAQEYAAGQERSAVVRMLVRETGTSNTTLAFHAGIGYQTLSRWLRMGLAPDQYDRLVSAIEKSQN